jgi:hypothetical protein
VSADIARFMPPFPAAWQRITNGLFDRLARDSNRFRCRPNRNPLFPLRLRRHHTSAAHGGRHRAPRFGAFVEDASPVAFCWHEYSPPSENFPSRVIWSSSSSQNIPSRVT